MSQPHKAHWDGHGRFTTAHTILLASLLLLPGIAFYRLVMRFASMEAIADWHIPETALGYLLLISVTTYFVYYRDKKKAQAEEWRTPEQTLHLMELAGGWPGAFIAQRCLRHKISKRSYQWAFWAIIIAYQLAAFEFLSGWMISRYVTALVQKQLG